MKNSLNTLVSKNRQFFWDIDEKDLASLNDDAIVERLMAYGDMTNIRELEAVLSPDVLYRIFNRIKRKKRINLEKETINFFEIYLSKYEP